jgi:hypothetical protein
MTEAPPTRTTALPRFPVELNLLDGPYGSLEDAAEGFTRFSGVCWPEHDYFEPNIVVLPATREIRPASREYEGRLGLKAMSETHDQAPSARTKGRLFVVCPPSFEDLVRAASIPSDQCPRRYCWWWRSLSFEWDVTPLLGCTFLTSPRPPGMANADTTCCRCDPSSTVDHYEPREPHLLEDGFAVPRWYSSDHRRPSGEISYDLVVEDDMAFVEGCYQIGGCDWQVFIISKRPIEGPSWKSCAWESGVWGIVMQVPEGMMLNAESAERLLSDILGVGVWTRVQGPDSMQLR